ncbi:hypothetical protein BU16DRAFT_577264 [Lophium mytilinum]|uniref:Uncharacterized protein n=1 Tax=Lophium mytilinum TaxID=390894 RepID=A0A6A6RC16_9PEZI|nr:hypothetical protein BU16DRAFT_577264 [Lophium mytilinum]
MEKFKHIQAHEEKGDKEQKNGASQVPASVTYGETLWVEPGPILFVGSVEPSDPHGQVGDEKDDFDVCDPVFAELVRELVTSAGQEVTQRRRAWGISGRQGDKRGEVVQTCHDFECSDDVESKKQKVQYKGQDGNDELHGEDLLHEAFVAMQGTLCVDGGECDTQEREKNAQERPPSGGPPGSEEDTTCVLIHLMVGATRRHDGTVGVASTFDRICQTDESVEENRMMALLEWIQRSIRSVKRMRVWRRIGLWKLREESRMVRWRR